MTKSQHQNLNQSSASNVFFSCHRNIQHCSSKGNQLELVHHPYQPEAHYSSLKHRSKKKQEATCERFHFGCQQYISHQKYLLKKMVFCTFAFSTLVSGTSKKLDWFPVVPNAMMLHPVPAKEKDHVFISLSGYC